MSDPIVLYLGPSMLDGAPIVVLASVGSRNVKTGSMVQTWILRADASPTDSSKARDDSSVCGMCPRRHSLVTTANPNGGDCYVLVHNAPQSTYRAWERAGMPGTNWTEPSQILRMQADARAHGLRLGSYGDPMAVPHHVWADVIDALQPRSVVGYTHQWETLGMHDDSPRGLVVSERARWYRSHVMASCDSRADADRASALGWRFFLAMPAAALADLPPNVVQCLATRERAPRTCDTCGICDGARMATCGPGEDARARDRQPASVYLVEHGALSSGKARRAAALRVVS